MLKYTQTPNQTRKQGGVFQRIHYYALEKAALLFEWNQTRKSQFVAFFCAFTGFCQLLVIAFLKALDLPQAHALHPIVKTYGIQYLVFSCCLYLSLMAAGDMVKHKSALIKDIYCFLVLLAYGVGAVIITYFLGALSMATGVTLMMSPLVGLILFRNTMVLIVSLFVLPIGVIVFSLIATSKIPYTLLLETTANMHQNTSMLATLYGSGSPFLIFTLFVAYACIERWKQRENVVRALSTTDSLTALANRRLFLDRVQSYLSRPRMHRKSLSLIMMDLDNFKKVNDHFGHLVGDEVLKSIAQTVASTVRDEDLVARYGGEEFCILLPDTRKETAETIAKRILLAVQATVTHRGGNEVRVTASIGFTTVDAQQLNSTDINIDKLLAAIDQGLYAAKAAGKNTVEFHPLPITPL